jgi:hypothetical protein
LIIPARSEQATLINSADGDRWVVKPQGGVYKVVVGGADCNDPNTVEGCLIGGAPWLLVEDGVSNALTEAAPKSSTQLGGALATPPPTPTLSPTPLPPTLTPTTTPSTQPTQTTATPSLPVATATAATTASGPTAPASPQAGAEAPTQGVALPPSTVTITPTPSASQLAQAVRPRGLEALLPYVLIALGVVVVGGGAWFFLAGRKPARAEPPPAETAPPEPVEQAPQATVDQAAQEPSEEVKPRKRRARRKKSPPPGDEQS